MAGLPLVPRRAAPCARASPLFVTCMGMALPVASASSSATTLLDGSHVANRMPCAHAVARSRKRLQPRDHAARRLPRREPHAAHARRGPSQRRRPRSAPLEVRLLSSSALPSVSTGASPRSVMGHGTGAFFWNHMSRGGRRR
jgi:hypothetical protein